MTPADTAHLLPWLRLVRPTRRRAACGAPVEPGSPYCPKHQARARRVASVIGGGCYPTSRTDETALYGALSGLWVAMPSEGPGGINLARGRPATGVSRYPAKP
jgi:hypothetical protein